jgi:hypothetical protein
MDKASVLGEAIRYLKQMEEKVNGLEEEKKRKKSVESVVIVKKSQLSYNDAEDSSSDNTTFDETLPEIEARFCERSVLIRLHCLKSQGVIEKTISEIEKLHLKVINSSALTFGNFTLDITIIAQVISLHTSVTFIYIDLNFIYKSNTKVIQKIQNYIY